MAEKKSSVWAYFDVKITDNSKAVCKHCYTELSRGKTNTPKSCSTSSLLTHLRSKHPILYSEMNSIKTTMAAAVEVATATSSNAVYYFLFIVYLK